MRLPYKHKHSTPPQAKPELAAPLPGKHSLTTLMANIQELSIVPYIKLEASAMRSIEHEHSTPPQATEP